MKRSVTIAGHRTSVSIEEAFWSALAEIAAHEKKSMATLIAEIDRARSELSGERNLSSAIRVFVLGYYRAKSPRGTDPA